MSGPDPSRRCEMVLLVQAEFDGEIDAAQAAALAAHRAQCPVCQAAGRGLAQARELMREAPYQPMPDAARRRVLARLEAARPAPAPQLWSRLRAWWTAGLGFGLGAACSAALALLILAPGKPNLTRELVADHIRALQPGHLEDVVFNRPAHGQAVVRWSARLRPAGQGFGRNRLSAERRPARLCRRPSRRGARLPARQAHHRPLCVAARRRGCEPLNERAPRLRCRALDP